MARARWVCLGFLVVATVAACRSARPEPVQPRVVLTAEEANARVAAFLEGYLQAHPDFARYQGLHAFDGRVVPATAEQVAASLAAARDYEGGWAGVDVGALPDPTRLDVEVTRLKAQQEIFDAVDRETHRRILTYGDLFDVSSYLQRDYAPAQARVTSLVDHLEAASAQVDNVLALLAPEQPRTHLETARIVYGGLQEYLQGDVVTAVGPVLRGDDALRVRFERAQQHAVKDLQRILAWIEQAMPRANNAFRLGEARLLRMLEVREGLRTDLPTLRRMAQQDFERNRAAFVTVAARLFPGKTPEQAVALLAQERIPSDEVLATATRQLKDLRAFIESHDVVSLPGGDEAVVMQTPPFMRTNSAFLDNPGPFEEKARIAFFYISPPDPSWSREKQEGYLPYAADLMATSVHEVYPGHFVHSLHQRQAPTRVARMFASYAFTEGWAHYTEQMMLDVGLGDGDDRMKLGQLSNALLRNCRFLVALDMHAGQMGVEAAQRVFQERCFVDEGNAQQQAYRGTYDPGFLSYTLGKLQILALRERFAQKRGTPGLKAFHDWLLGFGGAPVELISRRL